MTKKKDKKSLENEVKELRQHTEKYVHVPIPALLPLLGTLIAGLLSWANLQVIFSLWTRLGIDVIFESVNSIQVPLYSNSVSSLIWTM